ncbi:hypothetical protein BJ508DRAFT_104989 [Ascobolus immersus RN42]|uniref:CBF1-interacting co-repressor CIR N-terminal domain-containing protein n=1 Tax=Ascobolus immersus RN42 TaxID=1160509 RepID=A0A3N4I6S5_ASCIM|nr:hypothetical protein BJ508DRAFT_104989 [Ascobolus immersus RN42]
MGGDLNLKKSWHPNLLENQKRVWEDERKALLERKRIEELRKEVKEERALEELRKASTGSLQVQQSRVEWLYASAAKDSLAGSSVGNLLGRRRGEMKLGTTTATGAVEKRKPTPQSQLREDPLSFMKLQEISQRRKHDSTTKRNKDSKVVKSHGHTRARRRL